MASSDGFTHFLLSMGSLENNSDSKISSETLFKILDFCQVLQKKHQFLEGAVNELRSENGYLRAQVDKLRVDLAQRVETIVDRKTHALQARLREAEENIEASRQTAEKFVTLEEVSALATNREQDFQRRIDARISEEISKLAPKESLDQTQATVDDLRDRFGKVSDRLQDWSEYRRLQEQTEIGEAVTRTPFGKIHLLHPFKSSPLRWELKNFSNFKRLASGNTCRRLYSRPFGIEKDGTVRCVLRVLVVMLPNEDVFQFALEVLYATKYKRKFDFRFQILSSTQGKSMVKTFSSTEACIPRYWFPQNELQPSGLVSFAFAVTEEQLIKGDMLVDDKLLIQVGLRE